jgi:hypothetical protein
MYCTFQKATRRDFEWFFLEEIVGAEVYFIGGTLLKVCKALASGTSTKKEKRNDKYSSRYVYFNQI